MVMSLRSKWAAEKARGGRISRSIRNRRATQSPAHFQRNPLGETLEKLIRRSGRLEIKLALEIARQVAAGLAAVHKQRSLHLFLDKKPGACRVGKTLNES